MFSQPPSGLVVARGAKEKEEDARSQPKSVDNTTSQPWRWGFMHHHFILFGFYGSYPNATVVRMDMTTEREVSQVPQLCPASSKGKEPYIPEGHPLAAALLRPPPEGDQRYYIWTKQLPVEEPVYEYFSSPDTMPS